VAAGSGFGFLTEKGGGVRQGFHEECGGLCATGDLEFLEGVADVVLNGFFAELEGCTALLSKILFL
jgi:hypothetical protein